MRTAIRFIRGDERIARIFVTQLEQEHLARAQKRPIEFRHAVPECSQRLFDCVTPDVMQEQVGGGVVADRNHARSEHLDRYHRPERFTLRDAGGITQVLLDHLDFVAPGQVTGFDGGDDRRKDVQLEERPDRERDILLHLIDRLQILTIEMADTDSE